MLDVALHTGIEHPNVWWIVVPALLSFLAGALLGRYSDRLRSQPDTQVSESA